MCQTALVQKIRLCDKLTTGLFKSHAGGGCGGSFRGVTVMNSMPLGIATAVAFFSIVSPVSADMVTVTYTGINGLSVAIRGQVT